MGYHKNSTLVRPQITLKPLRHPSVKMVGRLVKYQYIRPRKKRPRKCNPLLLTAGQPMHHRIKLSKAKLAKYRLGVALYSPLILMGGIRLYDILIYRASRCKFRVLRKISYMNIIPLYDTSLIRCVKPCGNL